MGLEIERKFLIKNDSYKSEAYKKSYIQQGFLNSDKERTVRIRIIDEKAYITIKGKTNKKGTTRFEWEQEISLSDAKSLMKLTEKKAIEKNRYYIKNNDHIFEVDEFLDNNLGLVVAEIELLTEEDLFHKPNWIGEEVTGDIKYYNSSLSIHPFNFWT